MSDPQDLHQADDDEIPPSEEDVSQEAAPVEDFE
jgi:hypothetical protein